MAYKTESSKRTRQNLLDTDGSTVVTRGEAGREEGTRVKGLKHVATERTDFGWRTCNAVVR